MYACEIKETTNGSGGCARGKAWKTFKIGAQGRFAKHVQVDEQSGASQNGQDQAKKIAEEEAVKEWRSPDLGDDYLPVQGYDVSPFCMMSRTSLRGSMLTLLAPVKG